MTSLQPTKSCSLRATAERAHEACPGDDCAFWVEHACLVETLGLPLRRDLAGHLLELRLELEAARSAEEAGSVHARTAGLFGSI